MKKCDEIISGSDLRRMLTGAYRVFVREKDILNSLNIFPVPDGDTGTNMLLTMQAVVEALEKTDRNSDIGIVAKVASDSAIMGARGNSGVILSQIVRGLGRALAGKKEAHGRELGKAFQYGIIYAYRAVEKPVEGTILTVARGMARGVRNAIRAEKSIDKLLAEVVHCGRDEVERTPDLLPMLKKAGVVDAGGQGLLVFMQGCREGLANMGGAPESDLFTFSPLRSDVEKRETQLTHPYCTEFMVFGKHAKKTTIYKEIDTLGDSIVIVDGDGFVKVHLHTANPGKVLDIAINWGVLTNIKIDNMSEQTGALKERKAGMEETTEKVKVQCALITVVAGDGFKEICREMGVFGIVDAGKTGNPPVEDFMRIAHVVQAKEYIILPNNKNVILAAQQVQKLLSQESVVLPTKNIIQGLAAMLAFDAEIDLQSNVQAMQDAVHDIKAGAVSKAARDSEVDDVSAQAGEYIVLVDGKVAAAKKYLSVAVTKLIELLVTEGDSMISLYYGNAVDQKTAAKIADEMKLHYEGFSVELYCGGQDLYYFWASVE